MLIKELLGDRNVAVAFWEYLRGNSLAEASKTLECLQGDFVRLERYDESRCTEGCHPRCWGRECEDFNPVGWVELEGTIDKTTCALFDNGKHIPVPVLANQKIENLVDIVVCLAKNAEVKSYMQAVETCRRRVKNLET